MLVIAAAVSMNNGFRVRILIIIITNKCSHALQMLLFSATVTI